MRIGIPELVLMLVLGLAGAWLQLRRPEVRARLRRQRWRAAVAVALVVFGVTVLAFDLPHEHEIVVAFMAGVIVLNAWLLLRWLWARRDAAE